MLWKKNGNFKSQPKKLNMLGMLVQGFIPGY